MEGLECCTKIRDQGESEPPQSRVSTFSVGKQATNPYSDSQQDNARFHRLKQHSDFEDTSYFLNQPMTKIEECHKELSPFRTEENDDIMSFMGQESDKQEERDAELCQQAREDNDKKSRFLCQEMSEPEECDVELPQFAGQENEEEQSSLLSQQMDKPENFIGVNQCKSEDGDQKSDFVGILMDKPEECIIRLPQHRKEESFMGQQVTEHEACGTKFSQHLREENGEKEEYYAPHRKQGKYFYYDSPLSEETGVWIPVSVPPLSESEHEEWARGLNPNGGYFPEGDLCWSAEEDKELTMWDVVVEMLLAARGKVGDFASGDIRKISWISGHLIEQAWKEIAETLTEANCSNTMEILETNPPKWLPDSAASSCMLCSVRFHPILCKRHHCRFCGGVFCRECTRGRSLLPAKFHVADPQRLCDVCCVRLESIQPYLMDQVSRAAQLPIHDVTDLSTLRSWVNFPWGQSMEHEIYKAANTIRGYNEKVGYVRPEKAIPDAVLRQAKGLAILTIVKVGMVVTYNIGTGLVIARREDGSWSPPSAITSFGVGWGAQAGGELIDFIIVLRTNDAIKMFSGDVHFSIGAGLGAAVGIVGRTVEADVRAGDGGYAACYTYSCSKGAFVGCSLEGSMVTTRMVENSRFYGSHSINASDILLGSLPQPPAASTLYRSLGDLYQKLQK